MWSGELQWAIFDGSNKKRITFVRQLAEADAEYYSVHALKSESKNKTATPPSKEAEQSILDKTLNKRINPLLSPFPSTSDLLN
jgi:hypothetical protein